MKNYEMRPQYPDIEVNNSSELETKHHRHNSLNVPHVPFNYRPNQAKERMYPSLQLDPKSSNPLTSLFNIPKKSSNFWQSLETIQKNLNDHYKIVEKMEISPSVFKILFK